MNCTEVGRSRPVVTGVKVPSPLTFTRAPVSGSAGEPGGPPDPTPWDRAYSVRPRPNSTSTSRGLPEATCVAVADFGPNDTTLAVVGQVRDGAGLGHVNGVALHREPGRDDVAEGSHLDLQ